MKYYSKDHEWVEMEDGTATVGITKYAADELGDVTFVELPERGAEFEQGEPMAAVESVKAASDVFAPLSGKITAVNEEIIDHPEIVNDSPEEEGWFCKLGEVDEGELENLMTDEEYRQYIEEEKEEEEDNDEEEE